MALFTNNPVVPVSSPEWPDNTFPFQSFQRARQIYVSSPYTFTVGIAENDTFGSGCSMPLVTQKTVGAWSVSDSSGWQDLIDNFGYFFSEGGACESGGLIHFIFNTPAPFFVIHTTFDMTTQLWATTMDNPYLTGPGATSQPAGQPLIGAFSTGDLIAVWGSPDATMRGSRFAIIDGLTSIFGAAQTLVAPAANQIIDILGLVIDDTDTAHVIYILANSVGPVRQLWSNTITFPGLVVGTPVLIEDPIVHDYRMGPGIMFNGNVTFTGAKELDNNVYLWETDPSVISWTRKTVATRTTTPAETDNCFACPTIVGGPTGSLYIVWPENNSSVYPLQTATVQYSVYNGTVFSAKAVAWDCGLNQVLGAGIAVGDVLVKAPNVYDSVGTIHLIGLTDINASFDETEVYLSTTYAVAPVVICDSPPDGIIDTSYTHTFPASLGTPPYTFSITSGALPTGVTLDSSTGVASGTATASGTFNFRVQVTDSAAQSGHVDCSILIMPVASGASPLSGATGYYYNYIPTGTGPFSITAGTLPPGLSLNTSTGVISGLAGAAGTYPFTISNSVTISTSIRIDTPSSGTWNPGVIDGPPGGTGGWGRSTDCAREGTFGMRHIADGTAENATGDLTSSQVIPVEEDQRWYLSFWFKTSGGADGTIGFGFVFYDENNLYVGEEFITSAAHPTIFTQVVGNFLVPANAVIAIPTLRIVDHLVDDSVYCIDSLFATLTGGNFIISSIKHYFDDYTSYR